jgi:hypothetical protein
MVIDCVPLIKYSVLPLKTASNAKIPIIFASQKNAFQFQNKKCFDFPAQISKSGIHISKHRRLKGENFGTH